VTVPDGDDVRLTDDFDLTASDVVGSASLKGSSALDWGMRNRLERIFDPTSRRTVMLAFDHGYFQGPTTGLERLDLAIPPLIEYADALMCTRGALRSTILPSVDRPVVLRATGGQSILKELSNELVTVDVEDAIRINASALCSQVYVGAEYEHESIRNLAQVVNAGNRWGLPTLGVVGVGKELTRDARYFRLATRIIAETGANIVKSYYVEEGFESVVAACPVPIVIAGGKKLPEHEALTMAYRATQEGAAGVDMGRNIFQSDSPVGMIRAVRAIVHDGETPDIAFALFESIRSESATASRATANV
jgi:putative autoinducer-2 (AI-2) aldolase